MHIPLLLKLSAVFKKTFHLKRQIDRNIGSGISGIASDFLFPPTCRNREPLILWKRLVSDIVTFLGG